MDFTTLGRTGLKVSVMGLGSGGPSRLGKGTKKSQSESIAIVKHAINAGVNFLDTSELYQTERIIGKAMKDFNRESLILSTKKSVFNKISPEDVRKSLTKSLKILGTEYIDIYNLHAVPLKDYDYLVAEIVPTLQELRDQEKIRFIGITEFFIQDSQHLMLQRAIQDDIWDVMMVGFNMLNQSARDRVFQKAIEKNIGILIMFAVRLALSRPERLKKLINELIKNKQVKASDIDIERPLDFLVHEGGAKNVVDAAYRFCRYEPGVHVTLSGTGNIDHLKENCDSFSRRALPQGDLLRLKDIFQNVDSVTGQ